MKSVSLRSLLVACLLVSGVVVVGACSEDSPESGTEAETRDGGGPSTNDRGAGEGDDETDIDSGAAENDSSTSKEAGVCGPIVTTPGETCVGFGAKPETCDPSCEQPYGYVCFDGAPPGFEGCRKVSESTLGQTDVLLSEERLRRAARSGRDVQRFGG